MVEIGASFVGLLAIVSCLTVIGAVLLGVGLWKLISKITKKKEVNKMKLQHDVNAKALVVDLNTLEPKPFSGWDLKVQGEATVLVDDGIVVTGPIVSLAPVAASYDNPRFGRVEMGGVPGAGYTQYSYREHRGGVIDVPYAIKDGQLLLGIFQEPRFLVRKSGKGVSMSGMPGGFADPGEDALTAAKRELEAELGMDVDVFPLLDPNGNQLPGIIANRAFVADDDDKNSNKYFGLRVDAGMLSDARDGTFRFNFSYMPSEPAADDKTPEANAKRAAIKNAKAVSKLVFVPWMHLGLLGRDGLIQSGAFRIVSMFFMGLLPGAKTVSTIFGEIAGR